MQYLKTHRQDILIFFLCAVLVFVSQFMLLKPVLEYRLFNTTEDWPYITLYHSLDLNFWDKLVVVWKTSGLHTSAQVFHIGILSDILKFNYSAYQVVNVVLKAIGTLSLFPLVLVLFKSRKLAFLATILFGLSSATAGSFLWIVKGSEYIGIMLLNIFLITYYYLFSKNSKLLLLLSGLLFLSAYLMAPPRMFPQLLLIPLVETYWLLKTRKLKNLKFSVIRMIVFFLPVILISLPAPVSPGFPFTRQPVVLLKEILNGNWYNLLDPFAGIGWTLLTNDYWQFFGKLQLDTFRNFDKYLVFLFSGPFFIFGTLTLILAFILSKRPFRFYLLVFAVNFILEILTFFVAGHHFNIFPESITADNRSHFIFTKYPTFVAIYIFTVSFFAFLEWQKDKINNLLKAIWVGPIFSVIFLWPTWIIMGPLINDWMSVHWYFGLPAMGMTLFLAAILVLTYEKLKNGRLLRVFAMFLILTIIIIFYRTHESAIAKQYLGINSVKVSLKDQQKLHEELIKKLGDAAKEGDVLVYLEITEDLVNLRRTPEFYKGGLVVWDFGDWVHFRRGNTLGCIDAILDKDVLISAVGLKENERGFLYKGRCLEEKPDGDILLATKESHFYKTDGFYAFRIKNGEFINIRNEILEELRLNP